MTTNQKSPPRRIAVCECGNEWLAGNVKAKKPSRCSECGSRNVWWKYKSDGVTPTKQETENPVVSEEVVQTDPEIEVEAAEIESEIENQQQTDESEEIEKNPAESVVQEIPEPIEKADEIDSKPKREEKLSKKSVDSILSFDSAEPTFEEIKAQYEKSVPGIHPLFLILGIGAAAMLGLVLFRSPRPTAQFPKYPPRPSPVPTTPGTAMKPIPMPKFGGIIV